MFILQLIAHLKMEVQCLKEELSLVKGIQRNDHLTAEETEKYVRFLFFPNGFNVAFSGTSQKHARSGCRRTKIY